MVIEIKRGGLILSSDKQNVQYDLIFKNISEGLERCTLGFYSGFHRTSLLFFPSLPYLSFPW